MGKISTYSEFTKNKADEFLYHMIDFIDENDVVELEHFSGSAKISTNQPRGMFTLLAERIPDLCYSVSEFFGKTHIAFYSKGHNINLINEVKKAVEKLNKKYNIDITYLGAMAPLHIVLEDPHTHVKDMVSFPYRGSVIEIEDKHDS